MKKPMPSELSERLVPGTQLVMTYNEWLGGDCKIRRQVDRADSTGIWFVGDERTNGRQLWQPLADGVTVMVDEQGFVVLGDGVRVRYNWELGP